MHENSWKCCMKCWKCSMPPRRSNGPRLESAVTPFNSSFFYCFRLEVLDVQPRFFLSSCLHTCWSRTRICLNIQPYLNIYVYCRCPHFLSLWQWWNEKNIIGNLRQSGEGIKVNTCKDCDLDPVINRITADCNSASHVRGIQKPWWLWANGFHTDLTASCFQIPFCVDRWHHLDLFVSKPNPVWATGPRLNCRIKDS